MINSGCRRLVYALFLICFSTFSQAAWVDTSKTGDVAYFLFDSPASIKRYSLPTQTFLADISLAVAGTPNKIHSDIDGLYVSYGQAVYRSDLGGANELHLEDMSGNVTGMVTTGNILVITAGLQSQSLFLDFYDAVNHEFASQVKWKR